MKTLAKPNFKDLFELTKKKDFFKENQYMAKIP
jgi:hypothetical protein